MEVSKQVCSLEQAKKLKELGVTQLSVFHHYQENTPKNPNMSLYGYKQENMPIMMSFGQPSRLSTSNVFFECSAFTVSELGIMLPEATYSFLGCNSKMWCIRTPIDEENNTPFWEGGDNGDSVHRFSTEAESRAAMLIYLLENRLTPKEVNQRLLNA